MREKPDPSTNTVVTSRVMTAGTSVGRSWDDFVPPISCAHASSTSQLRHEPWQACA